MIDFDATALKAGMDSFAVPITIDPVVSIPGAAPYSVRGVWTAEPYVLVQENGQQIVTTIEKIGLRLSELPVPPPTQNDVLTVNGESYWLSSPAYDGQGGVSWVVKSQSPQQQQPVLGI